MGLPIPLPHLDEAIRVDFDVRAVLYGVLLRQIHDRASDQTNTNVELLAQD
jgi:hypothetical protein